MTILVITDNYVGPDRRAKKRSFSVAALLRRLRPAAPGQIEWSDTIPAGLHLVRHNALQGLDVIEHRDFSAFNAAQQRDQAL